MSNRQTASASAFRSTDPLASQKIPHSAGYDKTADKIAPADYVWVQVQQTGGNEKWKWRRHEHVGSARYATIQRFAEPNRTPDSQHIAPFYVEGDCKTDEDLVELQRGFLRLYEYFTEDLGIPDEAIRVHFSGSRSLHFTVSSEALGIEPSPHVTAAFKLWASDLAERFNLQLDLGVYSLPRMWRQSGSRHEKSRLYKIPLGWQDLTRPIDEIRELAREPRPELWDDDEPLDVASLAAAEYRNFLAQATAPRPTGRPPKVEPGELPGCARALFEHYELTPGRTHHDALLQLGIAHHAANIPIEEAETTLAQWLIRADPGNPHAEHSHRNHVTRLLRSVYQIRYRYSCRVIQAKFNVRDPLCRVCQRGRLIKVSAAEITAAYPGLRRVHTVDEVRPKITAEVRSILRDRRRGPTVFTHAPGVGKSKSTFAALISLYDRGELNNRPVVVLAPTLERLEEIAAELGGRAAIWRGRCSGNCEECLAGSPCAWYCADYEKVQRLASQRHNPRPYTCHEQSCRHVASKKAAVGADSAHRPYPLVLASMDAALADRRALKQFKAFVFDEGGLYSALWENVAITNADFALWRVGMDDWQRKARRYPKQSPVRRFFNVLQVALDKPVSDFPEAGLARPVLQEVARNQDEDWDSLLAELCDLDEATKTHTKDDLWDHRQSHPSRVDGVYDFEMPRHDDGLVAPKRLLSDLVRTLIADADASERSGLLFRTPAGLELRIAQADLVGLFQRRPTIACDATPNPLLDQLFPDLRIVHHDVRESSRFIQITDTLNLPQYLAAGDDRSRKAVIAAIRAVQKQHSIAEDRIGLMVPLAAEPAFKEAFPDALIGHPGADDKALNKFDGVDLFVRTYYQISLDELARDVLSLRAHLGQPDPEVSSKTERLALYNHIDQNGDGWGIRRPAHVDPEVDQLARYDLDANARQAFGRSRAVNRSSDNPVIMVNMTAEPTAHPIDVLTTTAALTDRPAQSEAFRQARDTMNTEKTERVTLLVTEAIAAGAESLHEIARRTGLGRPVVRKVCHQGGFTELFNNIKNLEKPPDRHLAEDPPDDPPAVAPSASTLDSVSDGPPTEREFGLWRRLWLQKGRPTVARGANAPPILNLTRWLDDVEFGEIRPKPGDWAAVRAAVGVA